MIAYLLPNPTPLEKMIAYTLLGSKKTLSQWKTFPSGEVWVKVKKGEDRVVVIGRTHPPAENIFCTLLLLDTLRRSGAKDMSLVLCYFAYARQDQAKEAGEALTAKTILHLFHAVGVTRLLTVDIHSKRVLQKSPIPITNLSLIPEMTSYLKQEFPREYTVIAADRGGKERAMLFARALGKSQIALIQKERDRNGMVRAECLKGNLTGDTALLVEDILDTGRTIEAAVNLLREKGCKKFFLCITHGVFSGRAAKLVRSLRFEKIFISDTLSLSQEARSIPGLRIVKAGKSIVEALSRF